MMRLQQRWFLAWVSADLTRLARKMSGFPNPFASGSIPMSENPHFW
jgi:hypothetical protein